MLTVTQVGVREITRNLPAYLRRVEEGEQFLILRKGKPVAEIKPVAIPTQPLRPFALCVGEFIVPDGFDAPLSEDVLEEHQRHC
jgi:antitoxin (DNA-binding transcriptional repressor) of toxin-antitoxin stability system